MSYEVYSLKEGHWNLDSVFDDGDLALHEARRPLKRRHEKGVKVVKENYDDETNKSIPTTIFHEGEGVKKHRPQLRENLKPRERIKTAAPRDTCEKSDCRPQNAAGETPSPGHA